MGNRSCNTEKPAKGVSRFRNGNEHISNCDSGYDMDKSEKDARFVEIHHILCITCLDNETIAAKTKSDFTYIMKCFALTDWNINDAFNVIGLPLKQVYFDRVESEWGNLPCHNIDHDFFIEDVNSFLVNNLWDQLGESEPGCGVDGADIGFQLAIASRHFRDFLELRGMAEGGTIKCWNTRNKIPDKWYVPFSMGLVPRRRKPPPDIGSAKTWKEFKDKFWKRPIKMKKKKP